MTFKKFISLLALSSGMAVGATYPLKDLLPAQILYVDRPVPFTAPPEQYGDLIKEIAPRYGIPLEVVAVLLKQEDTNQKYDYAFERGPRVCRQSDSYAGRLCLRAEARIITRGQY